MPASISTVDSAHSPPFLLKRSRRLDTLNLTVEEYEHGETGALHYHLANDNPENVFLVALRTVPMDSTGVAHVLEHTALCGSRRFPVRDPFFMMTRRSLNTFMNAFTSSDWTAYPFASQNKADFNNLLEVYLDAVFFPSLNELDFAQEGHRLEFAEASNPASPLEYKGVVYNEMKGDMSSPVSQVWQHLCRHLFPTTTYHYNSGGEPADIPALSYARLKDFHREHYHPSNAIFMTFGDIPAAEHQAKFQDLALKEFSRLPMHIAVGDERRLASPLRVTESYPLEEEDSERRTHIVMAWLLGKSTSLENFYTAQLLTDTLLDNSASPLLQALETSELGRSPSPLCGLEHAQREMSFVCGLEGCAEDGADRAEELILGTLRRLAEDGIDQDKVRAALHGLELDQREISGDSCPYGLQLILTALATAIHRGDPIELLDIDPALARLKKDIEDPGYIPKLINKLLLDNPHRVLLTVKPDSALGARLAEAEARKLAAVKAGLSEAEKDAIVQRAQALQRRQQEDEELDCLPKVELGDVPADISWPASTSRQIERGGWKLPASFYAQGTNGLSYQQIVIALPDLPAELKELLPLYTACLSELGVGQRSYLEMQALQAGISGGVSAGTSMRPHRESEQALDAYLVLSSKSLYANQGKLSALLHDTLRGARFDEAVRIREVLEQICSHKEQDITRHGHALAMGAACQGMSPLAGLHYRSGGMEGIRKLKALVASFSDQDQLKALGGKFKTLHQLVLAGREQFLLISEGEQQEPLLQGISACWTSKPTDSPAPEPFSLPPLRETARTAWLCDSQVNFCAMAFPTVPAAHPDAAPLTVLGGFLRNGFLHRRIREQGGAYGAGAAQDSGSAAFRFFSYRDPRLSETLDDFRASIHWLLDASHPHSRLEEAILGLIASLDKPASPAGTAQRAFYAELFGRTREHRRRFRERVLAVEVEQLKAVAEKYLSAGEASIGVVSGRAKRGALEELGLDVRQL